MAKKSELLYVKGMNLSESDGDDDDGDIWDDQKLNNAYDKALSIANAEVAKRLAMSTNKQNNKGDKDNAPTKKGKSSAKATKSNKKVTNTQWKSGMPCRAVYDVDGIEYEAFVLRIINDKECVVRFLGYDNSEIVAIDSLKPSFGSEERTRQIEQALDDKGDEAYTSQSPHGEQMDSVSERATSPNSTERSFLRKTSAKKKKTPNGRQPFDLPDIPFPMPNMSRSRVCGSVDMPLPPPPPPPFHLSDHSDSEDQAVSSMLLSWYMSGYYTGLYQGLKRAKESRRNV